MNVTLTIIVPQAHRENANHLGMAVGYSEADSHTYGPPQWQNGADLYSIASLEVSPAFFTAATSPLQRPAWDTDGVVDLAKASAAQALVRIWPQGDDDPMPTASTDVILALVGDDPHGLIAAAGLVPITQEDAL